MAEIENLNWWRKGCFVLWGKDPHEIAATVSSQAIGDVIKRISVKFFLFAAAGTVYVLVFRLYVASLLVENSTGLTSMQTLLWSFACSADYFLGTNIMDCIMHF